MNWELGDRMRLGNTERNWGTVSHKEVPSNESFMCIQIT